MAQEGPKRASRIILGVWVFLRRPFLGPSWAHLGLSWALLGPSWGVQEGILRQILGLEGLLRWRKAEMQQTLKNLKKINVFGRFLEATSLQKACKVAVWRSCCGLEGLKTATWMPCWLQTWINKASWSFRSTKLGSGSLHVGSNLGSDGLEIWKLTKTNVKTIVF